MRRHWLRVIALALAISYSERPSARELVPCAGGTLTIDATSDTPFTLPTFNVGQRTTLTANATGFVPVGFAWTIPGPHIKDYNDDLGTQTVPALASPKLWSTTALGPADLSASSLSFYWKPSAAQTHPLTGPPESRSVSLTVTTSGGGSCTATLNLMIERNLSDPNKQPEDLYTSTHRAPTATNAGFGHVVDEHIYWHQFVGMGPDGSWRQFLAWHTYFLRRFDEWRTEFGYDRVSAWYPGRPLPTGPAFDHPASLRLIYNADNNRIPTWFTIAGGTGVRLGGTEKRLADFSTLNNFSNSFEGTFHGQVHCSIGTYSPGAFFATDGPFFGSMCMASSPKDPMFWRWHGFIDLMYHNYCALKAITATCHLSSTAQADPWMADNAADVAANGNAPSPGPHWLSPDIWNRRNPVTTDACTPRIPPPNLLTVGGVTRDCGSSVDHENPVAGVTNYLYATLRNTRPNVETNGYAEVAVYIANASTGLSWPADFTMLPESRQLITIRLAPDQVTDIGPLPWTPPSPTPSDHFCLYIRVLSVQETPPTESANVDTNVANSNSIAWRNMKVVPAVSQARSSAFMVRNIREQQERLTLDINVTPELFNGAVVTMQLDATLAKALTDGKATFEGVTRRTDTVLVITSPKAKIVGALLAPRQSGGARIDLGPSTGAGVAGEVTITQSSSRGVDGGVTLQVGKAQEKR